MESILVLILADWVQMLLADVYPQSLLYQHARTTSGKVTGVY